MLRWTFTAQVEGKSFSQEQMFALTDVDVNTNTRFTLFLHIQQWANFDINNNFGFLAGGSLRNIGLIVEDLYQNVGFSGIESDDPDWNKNTKSRDGVMPWVFRWVLRLEILIRTSSSMPVESTNGCSHTNKSSLLMTIKPNTLNGSVIGLIH